MKTAAVFFSGLVLSALAAGPVAAEPVRVRLTARVSEISDPNNELAGKIVLGTRVNGLYVYNTNTPDQSPYPEEGEYRPFANQARMRFAAGSHVFESAQPTQGISIYIFGDSSGTGSFMMSSHDNKPLANGADVNEIILSFDGTGNLTQSDSLPNVAPILDDYWGKEVRIQGGSYSLVAQVEASELIVPNAMVVSPAAGSFLPNQHFDAAVILPRNSSVSHAHALANGAPVGLYYPGNCQLEAPNSAGRPALLCPGANAALSLAAGAPIEWIVELTNGTILTQTVNWTLAQ